MESWPVTAGRFDLIMLIEPMKTHGGGICYHSAPEDIFKFIHVPSAEHDPTSKRIQRCGCEVSKSSAPSTTHTNGPQD